MARLIVTEFLTLDGVYEEATPWQRNYAPDDGPFKRAELFESEALLLGRVTYEGFARYWPNATGDFAERMNSLPKYVVSSTLQEANWNNSTIISGDVPAGIGRLKEQIGGTILVYGSGTLAQTLLRHGLVDELRLMVFPMVLGQGKRLFAGGDRLPLQLASTRDLGDGVLLLTYTPAAFA